MRKMFLALGGTTLAVIAVGLGLLLTDDDEPDPSPEVSISAERAAFEEGMRHRIDRLGVSPVLAECAVEKTRTGITGEELATLDDDELNEQGFQFGQECAEENPEEADRFTFVSPAPPRSGLFCDAECDPPRPRRLGR
jgi:hypothetical protein